MEVERWDEGCKIVVGGGGRIVVWGGGWRDSGVGWRVEDSGVGWRVEVFTVGQWRESKEAIETGEEIIVISIYSTTKYRCTVGDEACSKYTYRTEWHIC